MQVYITLVYVTVFALAVDTASGNNRSNTSLKEAVETMASKKAMPGSASGAVKSKSGDNSSNESVKEVIETLVAKKAKPGSAS